MSEKKVLRSGIKTVTTAGTRVALVAAALVVRNLRLKAPSGNTGVVYVGDSTVSATAGFPLAPGETLDLGVFVDQDSGKPDVWDVNTIYADAATNGDKVAFAYVD